MTDKKSSSYGDFSDDSKEFIINTYDTPSPWINYLSNGNYCVIISQTGGGYSFYQDPGEQRVTRYRYNNLPSDRPGRYIYLRDNQTGKYWSAGWQPVQGTPQHYTCRHGLGYTVIDSQTEDIQTETTYFVPQEDDLELWLIKVTNRSKQKRDLLFVPYVEFAARNGRDELLSYPNLHFFFDANYDKDLGCLLYYQHYHTPAWHKMGRIFMSVSEPVTGYDFDREIFLGRYRSESNPQAIETGKFSNSSVLGNDAVSAMKCDLKLEPGQEKTIVVILGLDKQRPEIIKPLIAKYNNVANTQKALAGVKAHWQKYLDNFQVKTPSTNVNHMFNIWNQYQDKVTFDWSRYASGYHTGTFRGIGFRDTSQDTMGVLHVLPDKARDKIKLLARNMFPDGSVYHVFFPVSGTGDETKYGDDHLWLVHTTYFYLQETADLTILDEVVPYVGGGQGTIYEHLQKAVEYAQGQVGPHGLPKMFFADWNDCLNSICLKEKGQKGESVMAAMQLVWALKQLAEMAALLKETAKSEEFARQAEKVKKLINEVAWDGDWYVRAFTDDGKAIGSKKEEEGKIYLEPQGWAVISGVADQDRAKKCLDSVAKHLNTPYGIQLLDPPYNKFPQDIGSIIFFPAGIKENGAVFCHANTWVIVAESLIKRADKAYLYYEQILPFINSQKIGQDTYRVEPYVYCQFLYGPDHPQAGTGSHSWLTGTAVWNFLAVSQYILGIRPTYQGLMIDPCLPKDWPCYEAKRVFRGATYNIKVKNGSHGHGIRSLTVDGQKIKGNIIPVAAPGKTVQVDVELA